MKSELYKLQKKFDKSGISGNPIITDKELKELYSGLLLISDYMDDRGDKTMANALFADAQYVNRMILARKE